MNPIIQARKRFCLRLAEQILLCQQKSPRYYQDEDHLAMLIDSVLPLSYNESIAEAQEMSKDDSPRLEGPSLLTRMREALGLCGEKLDLKTILTIAVERLEEYKEMSRDG